MWHQIESNKIRSLAALILIAILFVISGSLALLVTYVFFTSDMEGQLFSFEVASYVAIAGAILMTITYFISLYFALKKTPDKLFEKYVFRASKKDFPVLYNIVEEMTIASGLNRMPKIYVLDSMAKNAFAYGVKDEQLSVIVTNGLLQTLNRDEMQGVIAHEIAHISNKDTTYLFYASFAVVLMTSIGETLVYSCSRSRSRRRSRRSSYGRSGSKGRAMLVVAGLVLLLMVEVTKIAYLFLSRKREYLADACAAQFTRYPQGLASALNKIASTPQTDNDSMPSDSLTRLSCIVKQGSKLESDSIFSTHPKTSNRIKILGAMVGADLSSYQSAYNNVVGGNIIHNDDLKDCKKLSIRSAFSEELLPVAAAVPVLADGTTSFKAKKNEEKIKAYQEKLQKRRECEDLMWKLSGYTIIECDCKTKLKLPKDFKETEVICPHCKKKHVVKAN